METLDKASALKKKVAEFTVDKYVTSDLVIGLGSGSTAIWTVKYIAEKYKCGEISNISCVTTGPGTTLEALQDGLPLLNLNAPHVRELDIVIDGADEFDADNNLVKGGGGCLLQEKIVAYSAKKLLIIVSENKSVKILGQSFPLPIEIIPSAYSRVAYEISNTYNTDSIVLRKDAKNIGPWITEEGNYILDIVLSQQYNPQVLESELSQIVGVVESGFFTKNRPTLLIVDAEGDIVIKE